MAQALVQAASEGSGCLFPHDPPIQPAHVRQAGEGDLKGPQKRVAERAGGWSANMMGSLGTVGEANS